MNPGHDPTNNRAPRSSASPSASQSLINTEDTKTLSALLEEDGVDEDRLRWLAAHGTQGVNNVFWRTGAGFRTLKKEVAEAELGHAEFLLVPSPCGLHPDTEFRFKLDTHEAMERWAETCCRFVTAHVAREGKLRQANRLQRVRHRVHWYYMKDKSQVAVAVLILSNFLVNIFEAQLEPSSETTRIFKLLDIGFTALFTAELAVNLFATLVYQFVIDPWNWFDLGVVVISLLSLAVDNLPGADVMRLMRCFRVFRLFKRIPSFRNIIVSLTASIGPMLNAFSIVCLVTGIYAIVAVNFFKEDAPENFAHFSLAFFSLFQTITGDAWSEHCRNLMAATDSPNVVASFYVSFTLLVSMVLLNVVIAVLLGAFADASADTQAAQLDDRDSIDAQAIDWADIVIEPPPFHRIARDLASSSLQMDMRQRCDEIFCAIAVGGISLINGALDPSLEGEAGAEAEARRKQVIALRKMLRTWRHGPVLSWRLSPDEFRAGIRGLQQFLPPVTLTRSTFKRYVTDGGYADEQGLVSVEGFRRLMRDHVTRELMHQLERSIRTTELGAAGTAPWQGNNSITAAGRGLGGLVRNSNDMAWGQGGRVRWKSVCSPGMAVAEEGDGEREEKKGASTYSNNKTESEQEACGESRKSLGQLLQDMAASLSKGGAEDLNKYEEVLKAIEDNDSVPDSELNALGQLLQEKLGNLLTRVASLEREVRRSNDLAEKERKIVEDKRAAAPAPPRPSKPLERRKGTEHARGRQSGSQTQMWRQSFEQGERPRAAQFHRASLQY